MRDLGAMVGWTDNAYDAVFSPDSRHLYVLQGKGQVVPFQSADSGLFTFFSPNNWEAQVKVLNGCAINGWVFGAAPTNVGFDLTIDRAACRRLKGSAGL